MEIEYLTDDNVKQWDEFVLASDMAWFRHTTSWLKYSSCCRFDSNTKNYSFMVKQNNEIVAVVPLLSEYMYSNREVNSFSMYGDYTPLPALKNNCSVSKDKIFDRIQEEMNLIASKDNVKHGLFTIDPLIEYNYAQDFLFFNLLAEGGEVEIKTTNIVDLRDDENSILQAMRKGHKAAIKQSIGELGGGCNLKMFDYNNISESDLLCFKEIHKIDAGRQTRTDLSWHCMYEWIKNGNAILAMLYSNELKQYVAGALVMMYKKGAYYASYATVNAMLINGHVGHVIQWEIIKYLKSHGIELYDIGRNEYSENYLTDEKLMNIARYKRGFRNKEFLVVNYKKLY